MGTPKIFISKDKVIKDIVDQNFKLYYPTIENELKHASFIAIDTEFTGIHSDAGQKYSFIDSLDKRYELIRKNIQPYIIIQFGIATFIKYPNDDLYKAKCYNFYLFPKSVPYTNRQFLCQASAVEFLSVHNFDFKKCFSNGISYINQSEEEQLKMHIEKGDLDTNLKHLTYEEEDDFKYCKNKVAEFLKDPNEFSLTLKSTSPVLQYMIHKELRTHFENIWTISGNRSITVLRVSEDMRKMFEEHKTQKVEQELLESYIGFCKVFKLLMELKKPIVGHNILLDLMFIHQQFYNPLPKKYKEFKNNIHSLFPHVYDTKFLSSKMKSMMDQKVNWKTNSLSLMYEFFYSKEGKYLSYNSPKIALHGSTDTNFKFNVGPYHTAGWDAYAAGYSFIKIGQILSIKKYGQGLEQRPVTFSELISSVKELENCINVSSNSEMYLKLDGNDPPLIKSEWLHVKLNSPSINVREISEKLSPFGPIKIWPVIGKRVLVAVPSQQRALELINHFQKSKDFQVVRYNPIWHAQPTNIVLWSSVLLSGIMVAWIVNRVFKKPVTLE